ncbi:MAG: DinB family protein [Trueperaceae bacterium]
MATINKQDLLEPLIDSYHRNNTILLNLLNALPESGMDAKVMEGSPSIVVMFSHIHQTRLGWLSLTASEFAENLASLFRQEGESRVPEYDKARVAEALNASAKAISEAVKNRVETGQAMKGKNATYDHPILLLQHMLWHEGYHVGQLKLALKTIGFVMSDEEEEKNIWSLWRLEQW